MPEQTTDTETDTDEQPAIPWAHQMPDSRISGTPTEIVYGGTLDETIEQNDVGFGVVIRDPEVHTGTLFVNAEKPSDGTTGDAIDDQTPRPSDYRIADVDDRDAAFDRDGNLKSDENGPNVYEEADGFDEDEIMVWYNGLSGNRVARTLDFNGRPFASWTTDDDPYLIKGLVQASEAWRNDTQDRADLVQQGKAPRVARAPVLRFRVTTTTVDEEGTEVFDALADPDEVDTSVLIDMRREGNAHYTTLFDADAFADDAGSLDVDIDYGADDESELEMPYTPGYIADDVLEHVEYRMHMYTGDGWQSEPANWSPSTTSETQSFGIASDGDSDDVDGFTAQQQQFVDEIIDVVAGSGQTPDEKWRGGIGGLIDRHADEFDVVPQADDVREAVYAAVSHLDPADLD